ncbi:hypothetical protein, partial [Sulfitobacter litoralis]
QCDLRLESRTVIPSGSSGHFRSFVPAKLPDWEQKIHLTQLFRSIGPPLYNLGFAAEYNANAAEYVLTRAGWGEDEI